MSKLVQILSDSEATVVSEYKYLPNTQTEHQTEAQLEESFINQLVNNGYERLNIHTEEDLKRNLRTQIEKLNNYQFSTSEWANFSYENFFKPSLKIEDKTEIIQKYEQRELTTDSGEKRNIILFDKNNLSNNTVQVINQYINNTDSKNNRYDVTILINGLPMVHVELKARGIDLRQAFNQITRYQRDSFWSNSGLYEFVQLFVISNGTETKYYSNTTRNTFIKNNKKNKINTKLSGNYQFASVWSDAVNRVILDLVDFTNTFLTKKNILKILAYYCVFDNDKNLLVLRPYQIAAIERLIAKVKLSHKDSLYGTIKACAYIWHATGSGKTLTSFKAAQLLTQLNFIKHVIFVVDRQDLDYQTIKEYDRFEKGCVTSNQSTKQLQKQIEEGKKIIVTTIQKLSVFIEKNPQHSIYNDEVVLVFDECHRSQFGQMHKDIVKKFKKYHIFGFTGTPIIEGTINTTENVFGERLHTYTLVNATKDNNVLRFHIEYVETMKPKETDLFDKKDQVYEIDKKKALEDSRRIRKNSKWMLDNFDRLTYRNEAIYKLIKVVNEKNKDDKKEQLVVQGFNALLATNSIDMAKKYYEYLKEINTKYKVAIIYSYQENEDEDENIDSTDNLNKPDRDFLESAIQDYNKMFETNFSTKGDKFNGYYKDVSRRMKNKELDILIVVNMFLTGFDAKCVNTLFCDRNVKAHGLIQAFSRTNRICNDIKKFGNIVCLYPKMKSKVDTAIALFGDPNAQNWLVLMPFENYWLGYTKEESGEHQDGWLDLLRKFKNQYKDPKELSNILIGEKAQREYVNKFSQLLRMKNILKAFDEFTSDNYKQTIISDFEFDNYKSKYISIYSEIRNAQKHNKVNINDDLIYEAELIEEEAYTVDTMLAKVAELKNENITQKELQAALINICEVSPQLKAKQELIVEWLGKPKKKKSDTTYQDEEDKFLSSAKIQLNKDVKEFAQVHKINYEKLINYLNSSFDDKTIISDGSTLSELLPKVSLGNRTKRKEQRETFLSNVSVIFDKYRDLGIRVEKI